LLAGWFGIVSMQVSAVAITVLMGVVLLLFALGQAKADVSAQPFDSRINNLKGIFERIRQSEEKYSSLIEHASDAIYMLDLADNFIEVNSAMCNMLGYTRDELLHMNIKDVLDSTHLAANPLFKGAYAPNQAIIRERRFVRKDGTSIDVEINVKMFSTDRVMVIARDITDKKRMEKEHRETEAKFRIIAERSMVGIYIIKNNKYAYVNPRFASLYGYEPDEMINTIDVLSVLDEEYQKIATEHIRARISGEVESVHYEARGKRKDGSIIWVELYGNRTVINDETFIIGTAIDITERKAAESVLIRSEANLQTILNTTDTAYALFDSDLKVFAFNHMAALFVENHYHHESKKGDKLADYFPPERFPDFLQQTTEVMQGKNISYEINYPQPGGNDKWYYVRLFPIKNDKEEIFGLMMALYDITERKNAEYKLQEAYDRIQLQVNHIREMNWKQSHLVRSPLANMKALVDILQHDPADESVLNHLQTELDRLDQVIIEMSDPTEIKRA